MDTPFHEDQYHRALLDVYMALPDSAHRAQLLEVLIATRSDQRNIKYMLSMLHYDLNYGFDWRDAPGSPNVLPQPYESLAMEA